MRAGLSTILQTLTPEAASVLNQSIAEAARRGHSQTTPLHVAATLLASPAGLLRQACVRSHPNTSHPLQCRALELCFSVALDRLPSSGSNSNPSTSASCPTAGAGGGSNGPAGAGAPAGALEQAPISNALMAALKRAQANQRRGCPEQQQQPLLAVKVEIEQLVVSILDDPGVSRVMREASFSSPAVKATIEQSLLATAASSTTTSPSPSPSVSNNSLPLGRTGATGGILGGLGFRPTRQAPGTPLLPGDRNLYLNPRLQQQQQQGTAASTAGGGGGLGQQKDEAKRMIDILLRTRKRNTILVGDSQLQSLMKEVLQTIENGEAGDGPLRHAEVIGLEEQLACDRSGIPHKLQELANSIDSRFKTGAAAAMAVVLNLGDLKWLVESPGGGPGANPGSGQPHHQQQQAIAEAGRAVVAEMAKLLARFAEGTGGRVWLVGTATSATYLRCQVYHPTMEDDWDLQAVPIAPRAAPFPGAFPRAGTGSNGLMGGPVESTSHQKRFPSILSASLTARRSVPEVADASRRELCPVCKDSYEHELAKLVAKEFEKSSSESKAETRPPLPPWLQVAKLSNGNAKPAASLLQTKEQELMWKQTTEELLTRWTETCSRLHPHPALHQPAVVSVRPASILEMPNPSYSPSLLLRRSAAQTKTQPGLGCSPLPGSKHGGPAADTSAGPASPPGSPVKTDLVLGRTKPPPPPPPPPPGGPMDRPPRKLAEELVGFTPDRVSGDRREKMAGNLDFDSFKMLFKGLTEKVSWQPEAASAVATTVMQCKSGGGRRRGAVARGDAWLLFLGLDGVGKKKMAAALSETLIGRGPVTVRVGGPQASGGKAEPGASLRGKTVLDRVVEAVRRDPFSVLVLENVDCADMLVLGSLKRAMERGRLPDSHGREVALGSAIFVLISDTLPEDLDGSLRAMKQCEEKLLAAANSGWQLELAVGEKPGKRRPEWLLDDDRPAKPRPQSRGLPGLSLDLNLTAASDEDATDSSRNSSDLTVEHEQNDSGRLAVLSRPSRSAVSELAPAVDDTVPFKPVEFGELRRKVTEAITRKFDAAVGGGLSLRIDDEALDRVVGGIWFGETPAAGFEDWADSVLVPVFQQLRSRPAPDGSTVVRLSPAKDGPIPGAAAAAAAGGDCLPSLVRIAVHGLTGSR